MHARPPQLLADLLTRGLLAGLSVAPAVAFALLPQPIPVLAGEPQLLAHCISPLSGGCDGNQENGSRSNGK